MTTMTAIFTKEQINNFRETRVYPKEFLLLFKDLPCKLPEDFVLPDYGKPGFGAKKEYKRDARPRKRDHRPIKKEIILVKGDNAWDPKTEVVNETEAKVKIIKGTLNKLTETNLDKLSKKLIDILKETKLDQTIIELIYNKSIEESGFLELYVKLIKSFIVEFSHYKQLVILKCQTEFQKKRMWLNKETYETVQLTKLELESSEKEQEQYKIGKLKRKTLGNLCFIFTMYKSGLVQKTVVEFILNTLLSDLCDETIEMIYTLVILLKTVRFDLRKYIQKIKSIKTDNIRLQSLISSLF